MNWSDLTIAIVGGDRREQEISRCAAGTGARVRAHGFPWPDGGIDKVDRTETAADARGSSRPHHAQIRATLAGISRG